MKLSLHKIKLPLNWFQTQRCEQISVYSLRLDVCSFSDAPRALCQMGLLANSNYEIDGEREGVESDGLMRMQEISVYTS